MEEIEIFIEIQSEERLLEEEIFEKINDSKINLGKGIIVYKDSMKDQEIKMKIVMTIDPNSYKPNITPTILGNIISSWLVYKLTSKKCLLKIDGKEIPIKKNSIRINIERKIERLF